MAYLECGAARLYYEIHGEGPPIVLAHGIGGNHASWFQQIPALARSYRVVAFDHRGFGNSTDPEQLGRAAFVDDLEELLTHLGVTRCALVGQSMGGGTCVGLAVRRPALVAGLVLADTLHGFEEPADVAPLMSAARAATEGLGQIERVLGAAFSEANPEKTALYRAIASFNAVGRRNLKGEWSAVTADAFAASRVPLLFIVGQQDILFPPAAVQALQRHLPGSLYAEISDAGHSAYFERPTEFNDSVLSFLQAIRYKGRAPMAHSNAPGYTRVG